ncbi:MAG: hypothetical protein V2A73_20130 [Pseudomonadota bacterium]
MCPERIARWRPDSISQIRAVLSPLAEAMYWLSGLNSRLITPAEWPVGEDGGGVEESFLAR